MKTIVEAIIGAIVIGIVAIAFVIAFAVKETWGKEQTNMLLMGLFMILGLLILVVGGVVYLAVHSTRRRRDIDTPAPTPPTYMVQPPAPPNLHPVDFLRYENARLDLERKRLALEQAQQRALPGPAHDPVDEWYMRGQQSTQSYYFTSPDYQPTQAVQTVQPAGSGNDVW